MCWHGEDLECYDRCTVMGVGAVWVVGVAITDS